MSVISWIILGLIAGFIGSKIVNKHYFSLREVAIEPIQIRP